MSKEEFGIFKKMGKMDFGVFLVLALAFGIANYFIIKSLFGVN